MPISYTMPITHSMPIIYTMSITNNTMPIAYTMPNTYTMPITNTMPMKFCRNLYKRAVGQPMALKKMKFFYKKYLQFEEKHGTESHVNDVKQKALDYVEGLQEGS